MNNDELLDKFTELTKGQLELIRLMRQSDEKQKELEDRIAKLEFKLNLHTARF